MMLTVLSRIQNQKEIDTQERIEMLAEQLLAELDQDNMKRIVLNNGGQLIYCPPIQNLVMEEAAEQFNKLNKKSNQSSNKKSKVQYVMISPEGEEIKIESISAFCREYFGYAPNGKARYISSFSDLLNGKRKEDNVHGWKIKLAFA